MTCYKCEITRLEIQLSQLKEEICIESSVQMGFPRVQLGCLMSWKTLQAIMFLIKTAKDTALT